jgi:adenylyltransferase/sulfurtransferase
MKQLRSDELQKWIASGHEMLLVDLREGWEREASNIGGLHIPMGELISRLSEIPKDKDVVFYCEKGIRSVVAIQRLETMGYDNLHNLSGGIKAWTGTLSS